MKLTKIHLLSAILASSLMVGCASTSSTDDSAAEEQARAEAQASADAQAAADAAARARAAAEQARADAAAANLETVFYFDFDQASLLASTRSALDAQIAVLKNSNKKVRLEGHADERGTREYNMALGERRANAVSDYLTLNGIQGYRVESISYGEERPISDGSNEMSYSKNRRVELK